MNPYLIIGALIFLAVACAESAYEGYQFGGDAKGVADQKQFDTINAEITRQKSEAHTLLEKAMDDNLALEGERDALKEKLGKDRNNARDKTDSLTRQLAFERLRFPASEASGCGASGGGTQTSGADASSPGAAPAGLVQLPDGIAADLRQLMAKADRLKDDYAECYAYATQVK